MNLPDLYFAFGSNLSTDQMAGRCPGSRVFLPGVLAGYRLAFMGEGSKWGAGGTATIEAVPGKSVPGLLYRMTPEDVEALNGFENYPSTYGHLLIDVAGLDGGSHAAFTYQRAGDPPNAPPMKYFHQIWRAYKAAGLPEAALLEAIEVSLNHGQK
jgi:hypothetical protein